MKSATVLARTCNIHCFLSSRPGTGVYITSSQTTCLCATANVSILCTLSFRLFVSSPSNVTVFQVSVYLFNLQNRGSVTYHAFPPLFAREKGDHVVRYDVPSIHLKTLSLHCPTRVRKKHMLRIFLVVSTVFAKRSRNFPNPIQILSKVAMSGE